MDSQEIRHQKIVAQFDLDINHQRAIIAKASYELAYFEAAKYLFDLSQTARVTLVDYLAAHYQTDALPCFDLDAFTRISSSYNYTRTVKAAISSYKSRTDSRKNPSWARAALKAADVCDQYLNREL